MIQLIALLIAVPLISILVLEGTLTGEVPALYWERSSGMLWAASGRRFPNSKSLPFVRYQPLL